MEALYLKHVLLPFCLDSIGFYLVCREIYPPSALHLMLGVCLVPGWLLLVVAAGCFCQARGVQGADRRRIPVRLEGERQDRAVLWHPAVPPRVRQLHLHGARYAHARQEPVPQPA